ncbi:MAG: hypothetical protein ACRCZY_06895, partial [Phocaeicola sp.]
KKSNKILRKKKLKSYYQKTIGQTRNSTGSTIEAILHRQRQNSDGYLFSLANDFVRNSTEYT